MREEGEQEVAERAVGRLDAGRQEQAEKGEDVLVGQALPVDLRLDELADEIVSWADAAFGDLLGEVAP